MRRGGGKSASWNSTALPATRGRARPAGQVIHAKGGGGYAAKREDGENGWTVVTATRGDDE